GNGRAMAILFAREGASVAVADRNGESAHNTVFRMKEANAPCIAIEADVSQPEQVRNMVAASAKALGGLDGLVYNVGIGGGVGLEGSTPEGWYRVFTVKRRAAMLTLQSVLPVLADGSSIVMISSIASMKPGSRLPSYDASKAAMAGLMRHAGLEGERRGIRVN